MNAKIIFSLILCALFSFPDAHSEEVSKQTLCLTFPHLSWSLEIEAPNFVLKVKDYNSAGTGTRFFATNEKTGVVMSAYLEKAAKEGDAKECRTYYWDRAKESPWKKDDLKMRESGDIALLEYLVKEIEGRELNQKNLNAYLSKDGYWIDIHLSKVDFKPGEKSLFKDILKNVRLKNKSAIPDIKTIRHYYVPKHEALTLSIPASWRDEISTGLYDMPTIILEPPAGESFKILISPSWGPSWKPDFNSPENIKKMYKQMGDGLLPTAEETKLTLNELHGISGNGYYYSLTDKAPKPGEYKYMTQGGIGIGRLLLAFTILTHTSDSILLNQCLEIFSTARQQTEI